MPKKSAGILLFRLIKDKIEFLLVHPGGPFWAKKDLGVWSIPKGEFEEGEAPLDAAIREFEEEMGQTIGGEFIKLSPVKLKSGKMIYAFAQEKNIDTASIVSNSFSVEWPPKSGKHQDFPEVDRVEWFNLDTSKEKINKGQIDLINELMEIISKKGNST